MAGTEPAGPSAGRLVLSYARLLAATVRSTGLLGLIFFFLGSGVGIVVALRIPPSFTSSATFIAQGAATPNIPSALQGLAASVGLGNMRDFSPQFYADLLTSRPVLLGAIERRYNIVVADSVASRTYIQIQRFDRAPLPRALDAALRHLGKHVAARADVRTNIVSVTVTACDATLSRDILGTLLNTLDSLNIGFRQRQSRELREFFESRAQEAQRELDTAEVALRHFLERNRIMEGSPLLQFEQARLTRIADLKRTVYTTVVQQYEEAKLQEARNVPVLTVLAPPNVPSRKSGPPRRLIVLLCAGAGFLLALGRPALNRVRDRG